MSMTALVSAFARAYHTGHDGTKIYTDKFARSLLSEEEYAQIAANMASGVSFFAPAFQGDEAAALRLVMDDFLSPTPLARAAFAAEELAASGAEQLLLLAAGYDAAGYDSGLPVFELDRPEVLADKQARLRHGGIPAENVHFVPADLSRPGWAAELTAAGFAPGKQTFCTALGLCYYLTAAETEALLEQLASLLSGGSRIVLDLPTARQAVQGTLAAGAGETMQAVYDRAVLESMAARCGLRLAAWLEPPAIQTRFFDPYNAAHPNHPMHAPRDVAYAVLASA